MSKKSLLVLLMLFSIISLSNQASCETIISPQASQSSKSVDYRSDLVNIDWWSQFNDSNLNEFIMKAANNNQDIKIAGLKVQEAEALVRESLGNEFPILFAGSDYLRKRYSETAAFPKLSGTYSFYRFPLRANYEVDLWKKNRERTIAEGKKLEAIMQDERAVYISLLSEVAGSYFNVVKIDKLIQLQQNIIDLKHDKLNLLKARYEMGLSSYDEVIQEDKLLKESQTVLSNLNKEQKIFLNQLAFLTGESPDNAAQLKRSTIDNLNIIIELPQKIASDSIKERPDILKSEAELTESRINVSLARKDFLPDIVLTGEFGFDSSSFSKIFNWQSYIAGVGVNLLETIFSGGQRRARLKAKKYKYEQMLQNYQKTLLLSLKEVNDSLISLNNSYQNKDDDIIRINFEKQSLDLLNSKYDQGLASYIEIIDKKEQIILLEKELIENKTDCFISTISLYKSLGGKL